MADEHDMGAAFAGARALVTGGFGFIGSALAARLVALGAEVALIDSLYDEGGANRANIAAIRDRVRVEIADIGDARAAAPLRRRALSLQPRRPDEPYGLDRRSARRSRHQLPAPARAAGAVPRAMRRAPGSSSPQRARSMAGRTGCRSTRRIRCVRPIPTASARWRARPIICSITASTGSRPFAAPHQYLRARACASRTRARTFIGMWLRRVLEGAPFEVWGGAQHRDLTYVDDVVEAFLPAALAPDEAQGRVFNIGGEPALSLLETRAAPRRGQWRRPFRGEGIPGRAPRHRHRRLRGRRPAVPPPHRLARRWWRSPDGLARTLAYFRAPRRLSLMPDQDFIPPADPRAGLSRAPRRDRRRDRARARFAAPTSSGPRSRRSSATSPPISAAATPSASPAAPMRWCWR